MKNKRAEIVARAKHHAQKLSPLAKMYADMGAIKGFKDFKTRVQLETEKAVYLIRPIDLNGGRYNGIEIKQYGAKESIKLMVV